MRGADPERAGSEVRNKVHNSRIGSVVQAHTVNLYQAAPVPTALELAKERLAGLVRRQWAEESSLRDLDGDRHIPVRWRVAGSDRRLDADALVAVFREREHKRLVVLGGAGTGKTSFAVALLRGLVRDRKPEDPVPVLVSAAGWEVDKHPDVRGWLVAQLERTYAKGTGLRPEVLAALVAEGHVLLILDGVDEMPAEARAAGISALDRRFSSDHQLIVTCRSEEYRQGGVLGSALVVEPEPLPAGVAADHLERVVCARSPEWTDLLVAVREGTAGGVGEIVTTAFGLWLVGVAGAGVDLDVVRYEPDPDVVRAHLLDRLVPTLVELRRPDRGTGTWSTFRRKHTVAAPSVTRREHHPVDVEWFLGLLATCLDERPFAWWELAGEVREARGDRWVYATFASVLGLVGAFCTAMSARDSPATVVIGLLGAVIGACVGLAAARTSRRWADEPPAFADFRLRGRGGRSLVVVAVVALAAGIMTALALFLDQSTATVVSWGAMCLVFGFSMWIESPVPDGSALNPMDSWRADRRVNAIRLLLVGLLTVVAYGIGVDLAFIPVLADARGDGYVRSCVLLWGVGFILVWSGGHRAWLGYLMGTARLAISGLLPRDLMPFLDDAHRMGLLRAVGPVYEFRHDYVRRYLAAKYEYWSGP